MYPDCRPGCHVSAGTFRRVQSCCLCTSECTPLSSRSYSRVIRMEGATQRSRAVPPPGDKSLGERAYGSAGVIITALSSAAAVAVEPILKMARAGGEPALMMRHHLLVPPLELCQSLCTRTPVGSPFHLSGCRATVTCMAVWQCFVPYTASSATSRRRRSGRLTQGPSISTSRIG